MSSKRTNGYEHFCQEEADHKAYKRLPSPEPKYTYFDMKCAYDQGGNTVAIIGAIFIGMALLALIVVAVITGFK